MAITLQSLGKDYMVMNELIRVLWMMNYTNIQPAPTSKSIRESMMFVTVVNNADSYGQLLYSSPVLIYDLPSQNSTDHFLILKVYSTPRAHVRSHVNSPQNRRYTICSSPLILLMTETRPTTPISLRVPV
jgi:hypothetical protein